MKPKSYTKTRRKYTKLSPLQKRLRWIVFLTATAITAAAIWSVFYKDNKLETSSEIPLAKLSALLIPENFYASYLSANFPRDRLQEVQSIRAIGRMESETKSQSFSLIKKRPDSTRLTIEGDDLTMTVGIHEGMVWQRMRSSEHEDWIQELEGEEAEAWSEIGQFYDIIIRSYKGVESIDTIESFEADGRTLLKVHLGGELSNVEIWIDPKTMHPTLKRESQLDGDTHEIRYSDYRSIDGITLPFITETWVNGTYMSRTLLESAELNIGVLTASFEMPKS